jgi:hypothetical protein
LGTIAPGFRPAAKITAGAADLSPVSAATPAVSLARGRPTNRSCSVDEIVIFRVSEGKITEAWEIYDEAGMWRQLGVLPPGAP